MLNFEYCQYNPFLVISLHVYDTVLSPIQEAIETFKEALKLKSDFIDAYKSLGQAYRYSGDAL